MKSNNLAFFAKTFLIVSMLLYADREAWSQTKPGMRIAFGSCNRQNLPQPMWDHVAATEPDLWIWLGDNIYGDTDDMNVLKEKYDIQKNQEAYKKFRSNVPVIGVWDDHDYGRNDAGKQYPYKQESQKLALDFLDEPAESPRRRQKGIYTSNTYEVGSKTVKVILLDARYHRDTLMKDSNKNYISNKNGDILGKTQWKWLRSELKSNADVYIISSGIQFLSEEHPYEKWANFPAAKKRFLDLLRKSKPNGVILLSGDRHIGEFSKISINGLGFPLYEITSSGLTHSAVNNTGEANKFRVGPLVNQKHYGELDITEDNKKLTVKMYLKGIETPTFHTEQVTF